MAAHLQENALESDTIKHTCIVQIFCALQRAKNFIATVLYLSAAHMYDGLTYVVSNEFSYYMAILIMTIVLFSGSVALVILHDTLNNLFQWDVLGIDKVNNLATCNSIPRYQVFRRLTRWALMKGGGWIHLLGSFTIGPPVVTLLLRKNRSFQSSLFYLITGTLISVIPWVTIWSGVGSVTWNQFVIPFMHKFLD